MLIEFGNYYAIVNPLFKALTTLGHYGVGESHSVCDHRTFRDNNTKGPDTENYISAHFFSIVLAKLYATTQTRSLNLRSHIPARPRLGLVRAAWRWVSSLVIPSHSCNSHLTEAFNCGPLPPFIVLIRLFPWSPSHLERSMQLSPVVVKVSTGAIPALWKLWSLVVEQAYRLLTSSWL